MPGKFHVEITSQAERDVEEIWSFIATDHPQTANGWVLELEKQVQTLETFPERCPLIPENELLGTRYRHLILGNYRVIFRVSEKKVFVLRLVHAARLLDASILEE